MVQPQQPGAPATSSLTSTRGLPSSVLSPVAAVPVQAIDTKLRFNNICVKNLLSSVNKFSETFLFSDQ
jgi:hypothetical protein